MTNTYDEVLLSKPRHRKEQITVYDAICRVLTILGVCYGW